METSSAITIDEPDDRISRTRISGLWDGITIYVIYHKTYENANVFTTDETKIEGIIQKLMRKYEGTAGEWKCRKLIENRNFEADMDM
jgi:hypothetical protein